MNGQLNETTSPRWRPYARALISFALCAFALGLALIPRPSTSVAAAASDPMIAAAGDIACDPANSNYNGGSGKNGVRLVVSAAAVCCWSAASCQ